MTSIYEIICVGRSLGEEQGSGRYALFGQDIFCVFVLLMLGHCCYIEINTMPSPVDPLHAKGSGLSQTQAIAVRCQGSPRNSFPVLLFLLSIGLLDFSGTPAKHLHCPKESGVRLVA